MLKFKPRQRFSLPKFPPKAASTFRSLCLPLPSEEIPQIIEQLNTIVEEIFKEAAQNPKINTDIVQALFENSIFLLQHYDEYSKKERGIIIGAVRYFAADDDPAPDTALASGFNDDVQVMNHALEQLGVTDRFISL